MLFFASPTLLIAALVASHTLACSVCGEGQQVVVKENYKGYPVA